MVMQPCFQLDNGDVDATSLAAMVMQPRSQGFCAISGRKNSGNEAG